MWVRAPSVTLVGEASSALGSPKAARRWCIIRAIPHYYNAESPLQRVSLWQQHQGNIQLT